MSLDLDNLPILSSFKELKRGDKVYSKKYGLGLIVSLYKNDEIIVAFPNLRKRFSVEEEEISQIPAENLIWRRPRVKVIVDGVNMSFKEFKLKNKLEKKRIELENKIIAFDKKHKTKR